MRSRRRSPLPSRIAIGLASFVATLGAARVASAQPTLSFSASAIVPQWYSGPNGTGNAINARGPGNNPYGVNFADCEDNRSMVFTLSVVLNGSSGTDTLQAWAGTSDCTQAANRGNTGGILGTCVPLSSGAVINNVTMSVAINARDVALAVNGASPSGTGGITPYSEAADDSPCFRQTSSAGVNVGIFFLPFPSGVSTSDPGIQFSPPATVSGQTGSTGTLVDMVGPLVSTGGSIGIGDTELVINWVPASDSDIAGFQLFCDPGPGLPADAAPTFDAQCGTTVGTVGDDSSVVGDDSAVSARIMTDEAGGDDSGDDSSVDSSTDAALDSSVTNTCSSVPEFDAAACPASPLLDTTNLNGSQIPSYYVCSPQLAGMAVTTYTPTNLTDGTIYTVAVAGYDISENLGAVYVIGCESPQPIREFWTTYRQDGGGAGGGFCALDAVGMPVSSTIFVGGFALTVVTFLRRRRSRRR